MGRRSGNSLASMGSAIASEGAEGTAAPGTEPEAKLSPRWEAALLEFARELDRRAASASTKRAYASDLAELAEWATQRGAEPGELRYRDLRGFAARLSSRGLAKSSVGRKLAAVRTFHGYLVDSGKAGANPGRATADAQARAAPAAHARTRRRRRAPGPHPGEDAARGSRPRDVRACVLVRPSGRGDREART